MKTKEQTVTEETPQGKRPIDPSLLETMRRAWRKWRDRMAEVKASGKKLCPVCHSLAIEKERKMCAVCEHRKSGRGVAQGNPESVEKR